MGAVIASKPLCSVCNTVEEPKYKCPKCRDTYCSIQCCRDHKQRGCSANKAPSTTESSQEAPLSKYLPRQELAKLAKISTSVSQRDSREHDNDDGDDDDDDDIEEGWKITESMTEAVQNSEWLKNELKDEGLRHLISRIVAAPAFVRRNQKTTKQEDELEQLKTDYPRFKGFLDKMLVVTDVLERHGEAAETDLGEWLQQEGQTDPAELMLKPIASEERMLPPLPPKADDIGSESGSSGEEEDSESGSESSSDSSSS